MIRSFVDYRRTISHEFFHAQYFLNPKYRSIVDKYWEGLDAEKKEKFKKNLPPVYDRDNDFLIKNGFQAYLLSGNLPQSMASFFSIHQIALGVELLKSLPIEK